MRETRSGPLAGVRVVEMASRGPVPFAGMMCADYGAEVVRVERPNEPPVPGSPSETDPLLRGRRSIALDLKSSDGLTGVREVIRTSDVLIEGHRPGVMERLGIGPEECLQLNPALVYVRVTGFGQDGPWAHEAGHDINYIALSGTLSTIGNGGAPVPPPSQIGDFGGGGMFALVGMLAALLHARATGEGQVVDVSMTESSAVLSTLLYGLHANGLWSEPAGSNFADTGSPQYNVYRTSDDRYVTFGALEPRFYAEFLDVLGLDPDEWRDGDDTDQWPDRTSRVAAIVREHSLDDLERACAEREACFAPVLSLDSAPLHPQSVARKSFESRDGIVQPSPAPRFSETPARLAWPPARSGADTLEVLSERGVESDIARRLAGVEQGERR